MATIKSYTDIEQSRKLAEILPLESADMLWEQHGAGTYVTIKPWTTIGKSIGCHCLGCWSLAALLSVLPKIDNYRIEIRKENNCFCCAYTQKDNIGDLYWYYGDNPVDACVTMVEKLHELNLL